ncbi:MAG: hypothetical protein NVSMB52_17470 [Chloroflexota bacterium]
MIVKYVSNMYSRFREQRRISAIFSWRFVKPVAPLVLLLVGITGLVAHSAPSRSEYTNPDSPKNPTVIACKLAQQHVCNPHAYATFVATNPLMSPPSNNTLAISGAVAIAIARKAPTGLVGKVTPATAVAHARFMSRTEYEQRYRLGGINAAVDPHRPVWVVTVHAPATDSRGLRTFDVYTVVIDADTGQLTDSCAGCNTLG